MLPLNKRKRYLSLFAIILPRWQETFIRASGKLEIRVGLARAVAEQRV
jgi:hypothetical protein